MSDYVCISLPSACKELAESLLKYLEPDKFMEFSTHGPAHLSHTSVYAFSSDMDEIHTRLLSGGIPYNYSWEEDDFGVGGSQYLRFTPEGKPKVLRVTDYEKSIRLDELVRLIDSSSIFSPINLIKHRHQKITPLPWTHQVEYGRLYRTHYLLLGNQNVS